jgi:hypothetical protein
MVAHDVNHILELRSTVLKEPHIVIDITGRADITSQYQHICTSIIDADRMAKLQMDI